MVIYLYRWRLKPGLERQFLEAWEYVTKQLRDRAGSLGSRLHLAEDGLYYAYAQWPSREARQSAKLDDAEIAAARNVMRNATETALPEIVMDSVLVRT